MSNTWSMAGDADTLTVADTSTVLDTSHGEGDHDRFSHYIKKDEVLPATLEGTPVKALCGKVWIPSRDPQRYTVCPMCKEIYEGLRGEGSED